MEEFYYFLFLCFLAFVCAFQRDNINQKAYNVVFFVAFLVYFYIVRLYPHDDMGAYRSEMGTPIELMVINVYFLRELVFWGGASLLYALSHDEVFVFLVLDTVGLILVFLTRRNFNLPMYYIPLFYLSFPGVMGVQNVYRQFLASVFFLCAISYLYVGDKKKGWLLLVLSPLIHNSVALFFPIAILISGMRFSKLFFRGAFVGVLVLLPKMVSSKSSSSTGLDLIYLYVFVMLLVFLLFYITQRVVKHRDFLTRHISFFLLVLTAAASISMGGAQSERTGMISIQIIIPFLVLLIESYYRPMILGRLIFIFIFIAPSFLFDSVINMLTNYM